MRPILSATVLLLTAIVAACSSSSPPVDTQAAATRVLAAPEDFWLSATVVGPPREGGPTAPSRDMRPGRYVMEPDHQLRVSMGPGANEKSFPPATRRLSAEQVAELWNLANANGLTRAGHPAAVQKLIGIDNMPQEKTTYIIAIHANGKRRVLVVNAEDASAPGYAEGRAIVDKLAEWAWMN